MRVVTSKQMKQIERQSLQHDLTYHRLMENAGSAAAAFIRRTFNIQGRNCMIFCGSGNNGGDGYVVARKLFENNANVLAVMVEETPRSAEAKSMYNTAEMIEIPIVDFATNREKILEILSQADIIVDAIYGTGFHGSLSDEVRAACTAINDSIAAVVALDIPSGVECDSGAADQDAVRADFTIAFDSQKPVHVLPAGESYCGKVEVVDIGIPDEARGGVGNNFGIITTENVFSHLKPRSPDSHKGDYGKLLSVCGSSRYRGAAVLSTLGALRTGAGLVTVATTEMACFSVAAKAPEAVLLPLGSGSGGAIDCSSLPKAFLSELIKSTAVLFGCGIGQGKHAAQLLEYLLKNADCPIIIDADGINALAANIDILREAKVPVILTPHPGEMARLTGKTVEEIEEDRNGAAMSFVQEHPVILVLKGPETVIADQNGGLLVNNTGNAGLARGGSGDVLAGMMAGFLAQGIDPVQAAASAVHLHGLAADRTASRLSQYGMLPSDLLDDLMAVFVEQGR